MIEIVSDSEHDLESESDMEISSLRAQLMVLYQRVVDKVKALLNMAKVQKRVLRTETYHQWYYNNIAQPVQASYNANHCEIFITSKLGHGTTPIVEKVWT